MTKSKFGKATRNIVVKMNFLLLPLDRYLFSVVSGNRYLSRGSKENMLSITNNSNYTISLDSGNGDFQIHQCQRM